MTRVVWLLVRPASAGGGQVGKQTLNKTQRRHWKLRVNLKWKKSLVSRMKIRNSETFMHTSGAFKSRLQTTSRCIWRQASKLRKQILPWTLKGAENCCLRLDFIIVLSHLNNLKSIRISAVEYILLEKEQEWQRKFRGIVHNLICDRDPTASTQSTGRYFA